MMEFWNGIADNPPVTASETFFDTALRSFARLTVRESLSTLLPSRRWLALWRRASNHFPPRRGTLMALWVEYLLTTRFELISHFLEGVRTPFVADTSQLRERLRDAFNGDYLPRSDVRLAINAVDAHTGAVVRFVNKATPLTRPPDYNIVDAISVDMILASASIPLLFPPVAIGNRQLWDGGLLVNTPLAPVVALGAEEIITVLVTEPANPDEAPFPHFGRAVERTVDTILENAYNVDRKLFLERNRLAHLDSTPYRAVKLYEAIRPRRDDVFNAGSYLYFERSVLNRMRAAGRRSAAAWLSDGPLEDHLPEALETAATPEASEELIQTTADKALA
jgi:predicted acylesterase/phospholipase RssA